MISQPIENSPVSATSSQMTINQSSTEDSELASLEEQLTNFYQEMEYLNQNFPNQSIRGLVDLTKSIQ